VDRREVPHQADRALREVVRALHAGHVASVRRPE
jgi:hypothetical protein